jgi:hypothetical protein
MRLSSVEDNFEVENKLERLIKLLEEKSGFAGDVSTGRGLNSHPWFLAYIPDLWA